MAEVFDIVDSNDQVVGQALRSECHGNPRLVHRVAHVLVFDGRQRLLLQKRSGNKDIQPGKWDTSVGGHLDPGEDYLAAARREMAEELGIAVPLTFLYYSQIRNEIEAENVATFLACYEGEVSFDRREIDTVRFWSSQEINAALGSGLFTPNFEEEWLRYGQWQQHYTSGNAPCGLCGGESMPDLVARLQQDGLPGN